MNLDPIERNFPDKTNHQYIFWTYDQRLFWSFFFFFFLSLCCKSHRRNHVDFEQDSFKQGSNSGSWKAIDCYQEALVIHLEGPIKENDT